MQDRKRRTGGVRWRTAAVVPVSVLAWITLGMTGGVAQAAAPVAHQSSVQPSGNGDDHGNGGTGNGKGNGNAKHEDPDAGSTPADPSGDSDHSDGTAGTSGDPSQPQPPSNADQNGGGANGDCGSYCSTRDGSPSGNGNGKGNAKGKPCAGCVGKADNKNPPGQYKDGSDHNNGYECDGNHGIGRSNPAHTGCTTTPPPNCETTGDCPPPPDCETTGDCPPPPDCEATDDCPPPPDCVPTPANHQCGHKPPKCVPTKANSFCSTVEGSHHVRKPPVVLGERVVRTPNVLPFTGANLGWLVASGTLTLGLGAGLLALAGRRARRHTA
ncbi:MAG: hypothetical protein QOJ03_1755 [Frankiaceae bacterium]|nr:hypothetical protein [Frankiaceae bacterium]